MTRRKDLVQTVIDTARDVVKTATYGLALDWDKMIVNTDAIAALTAAVEELDKLREIEKPRAAKVAPVTSHQAAKWVGQYTQGPAIGRIFALLHALWRNQHTGETVDGLMYRLALTHQSCSARVNELANAGWIVDSGQTRKTRTGREAIVWVPSPAALEAVDASH